MSSKLLVFIFCLCILRSTNADDFPNADILVSLEEIAEDIKNLNVKVLIV